MDEFEESSGSLPKHQKPKVVALNPTGGSEPEDLLPPAVMQPLELHWRYLGIQLASQVSPEESWWQAEKQIMVRLHLACVKTMLDDQRSVIAAAANSLADVHCTTRVAVGGGGQSPSSKDQAFV
ncbi:hypothetical protein GN958_ATG11114 [Phytophthora infestans]|uniref:Uncharacterized protein n=1 Tax=Phytophthora infestans TaxID=4787 RepID=A0A8S9UKL8_PHYIN|nr:hypothetical protein GN958_ATG11114 [Phytophthora infestans]